MKKLLLLVGTIVLILALCSCGGKEIEEEKEVPNHEIKETHEPTIDPVIESEYDMSKLQRIDVGDYSYYIPSFSDYFVTEIQQVCACGDFGIISTFSKDYSSEKTEDVLSKAFKGKKIYKAGDGAYIVYEKDGKSMAYFLNIGASGGQIIEIFTEGKDVKPYAEMILGTFGLSKSWNESEHNNWLCELCEYEYDDLDFEMAGDVLEYTRFVIECMLEGRM